MNEWTCYRDGTISVWCKECGHCEEIPGTEEMYEAIKDRKTMIQDILPDTDPAVREMFKSGWCGVCFRLNTSLIPDETVEEILGHAVRLGLLTEKDKEDVMSAAAVYLDPQRYIIDMLTELEWQDGEDETEDLRPQVAEFRQRILEIYDRAASNGCRR